jgi:hypothetical protein
MCEECGHDRPLTYRSRELGKKAVCAPCIRANHPETINMTVIGAVPAPDNPIWQTPPAP